MEQYMEMLHMKMKRQLTPTEKIAIVHEYEQGDVSMDALSKKYGVSKSTISRTIKSKNRKAKTTAPNKKPIQTTSNIPDDPILFRRTKLAEITNDIELARSERVIHSLVGFHRLQMNVHNELLEHIEAAGDEMREMSMDEQKRLLVDAFVNLPPVIRHELLEIIEAHESGNVIRLKTND
jgi:transposase-like protein